MDIIRVHDIRSEFKEGEVSRVDVVAGIVRLYNNKVNARALIGQLAIFYCAGRLRNFVSLLNYYII